MHGRLALALLALPLLVPAGASAEGVRDPAGDASARGLDIRRLEAFPSAGGMLVRVTLRAPLEGRIAVGFASRPGAGRARRSAVIHGRRSTSFLFTGDARNLSQVSVRTLGGRRGDRATLRLPPQAEPCRALTALDRQLRGLRRARSLRRAVTRSRLARGCDAPDPLGAAPVSFAFPHGLTPGGALRAGADQRFAATGDGEAVWDFGDGTTATGRVVRHAFAQPGRYEVLLTVTDAAGRRAAFGRELYVRGAGSTVTPFSEVACPQPGATTAVTLAVPVPSWARKPYDVDFALPPGPCGASISHLRGLKLTAGGKNADRDAWGRRMARLAFTFDFSGGTGLGAVAPVVTASWR
jgi:hypothetical protein